MSKTSQAIAAAGQPAIDETSTLWIGAGKLREDSSGQSVIVNLEAKSIHMIQHASKTYTTLEMPIDLMAMLPEEMRASMQQMMDQMKMEVSVRPSEDRLAIKEYPSKKFVVSLSNPMGLEMDMDVWTTTEIDLDLDGYKRMMLELAALQPAGTEWMSKLFEIEGFPVRRVTKLTVMGQQVEAVEELETIENRAAPPGTYAPPPDYAEQPFDLSTFAR